MAIGAGIATLAAGTLLRDYGANRQAKRMGRALDERQSFVRDLNQRQAELREAQIHALTQLEGQRLDMASELSRALGADQATGAAQDFRERTQAGQEQLAGDMPAGVGAQGAFADQVAAEEAPRIALQQDLQGTQFGLQQQDKFRQEAMQDARLGSAGLEADLAQINQTMAPEQARLQLEDYRSRIKLQQALADAGQAGGVADAFGQLGQTVGAGLLRL